MRLITEMSDICIGKSDIELTREYFRCSISFWPGIFLEHQKILSTVTQKNVKLSYGNVRFQLATPERY